MTLAAAVTRMGYQLLRALAPALYALSVLGLALVLTPVGSTVNGSHSWILLPGGFSIQPSEFAKAALCVGLAIILGERLDRGAALENRDVALACVVAAVPIGLVMVQPDLGSRWCSVPWPSAWWPSRVPPGGGWREPRPWLPPASPSP